MNRLTYQEENGTWGIKGVEWNEIPENLCSRLYGALCKLKDYEKSGFTPQEVEEMGQTYGSMATKCGYKAADEKMTAADGRKLLQVMDSLCRGFMLTKSEIGQITEICLGALNREEGNENADTAN